LDPDLAPDQMADTLLHETMHAVLTVTAPTLTKCDQEGFIQHLSGMLLATLRENPVLVAYILDDGHDAA
jgi:hypothetical protein